MGGGHLSRPDFGMPQPDPAHPLTEFYLLLQHGLDREGVFALPALWADFQAPARRIYADEAEALLTLREPPGAASTPLLAPRTLQLLYSSLHVLPDGTPAALLLTEECPHGVCGAAAAALRLGRPAPAPAGLRGGPHAHPHAAGCGGHRRRSPCAGAAALPGAGRQALACPPQGRGLPRRAHCVASAIVQTLNFCYTLFILRCNNRDLSAVYPVECPTGTNDFQQTPATGASKECKTIWDS